MAWQQWCRPSLTAGGRSEEHTSELQSHLNLVCRLLLEKKKNTGSPHTHFHILCVHIPQTIHYNISLSIYTKHLRVTYAIVQRIAANVASLSSRNIMYRV